MIWPPRSRHDAGGTSTGSGAPSRPRSSTCAGCRPGVRARPRRHAGQDLRGVVPDVAAVDGRLPWRERHRRPGQGQRRLLRRRLLHHRRARLPDPLAQHRLHGLVVLGGLDALIPTLEAGLWFYARKIVRRRSCSPTTATAYQAHDVRRGTRRPPDHVTDELARTLPWLPAYDRRDTMTIKMVLDDIERIVAAERPPLDERGRTLRHRRLRRQLRSLLCTLRPHRRRARARSSKPDALVRSRRPPQRADPRTRAPSDVWVHAVRARTSLARRDRCRPPGGGVAARRRRPCGRAHARAFAGRAQGGGRRLRALGAPRGPEPARRAAARRACTRGRRRGRRRGQRRGRRGRRRGRRRGCARSTRRRRRCRRARGSSVRHRLRELRRMAEAEEGVGGVKRVARPRACVARWPCCARCRVWRCRRSAASCWRWRACARRRARASRRRGAAGHVRQTHAASRSCARRGDQVAGPARRARPVAACRHRRQALRGAAEEPAARRRLRRPLPRSQGARGWTAPSAPKTPTSARRASRSARRASQSCRATSQRRAPSRRAAARRRPAARRRAAPCRRPPSPTGRPRRRAAARSVSLGRFAAPTVAPRPHAWPPGRRPRHDHPRRRRRRVGGAGRRRAGRRRVGPARRPTRRPTARRPTARGPRRAGRRRAGRRRAGRRRAPRVVLGAAAFVASVGAAAAPRAAACGLVGAGRRRRARRRQAADLCAARTCARTAG